MHKIPTFALKSLFFMSGSTPCLCGENHPPVYIGDGTAADPIDLDPSVRKHPICPIINKRIAEAEREHTLALVRKKIRDQRRDEAERARTLALIRRQIKEQQRGSTSGNCLGSIN